MKKIIDLLKLKNLDKAGTYNLYKFKTYDSQIDDFGENIKKADNKISFGTIKGFFALIFWGLISFLMSVLYFFLIVILGILFFIFSKKPDGWKKDDYFKRYLNQYYHKPARFYFKLLEGKFFSKVPLQSPSLEIGIEDGETSSLHFYNKKIDIGAEYVPDNMEGAKITNIFKNLICFDARKFCFKNDSLSTVLMVHILDHFQEIDIALKQINDSLRPGGILAFSALDKNFWSCDPLGLSNIHKRRMLLFNDLDIREFSKKIEGLNFEIISSESFLKGKIKYLWGLFFLYFECLGGTEIIKIFKKSNNVPKPIKKILQWSITNIFYKSYLDDDKIQEEGCHVFFIAKKPGFTPITDEEVNKDQLMKILLCPICHGSLEITNNKELIQCNKCKKVYLYINEIPIILEKINIQ